MYIATFYSYKGGVGRSMSMVNVGVQLAQKGRRVLLVDFDLEAPGLPTFSLGATKDVPGVIDFVNRYVESQVAADVSEFVFEAVKYPSGGRIWVMPAGRQDDDYSLRLNTIDWVDLYRRKQGFQLFEDLKRQWNDYLEPDYVLIDSRTGHSDVEGICTRQLPDSVCVLFFPNTQNLLGLKRVVANIRSEQERRGKKIQLHFVASNVPDLDDEEKIVANNMKRFRTELGFNELSGEIHHYNSLSLVNQDIFSASRPDSRLSKEYAALAVAITRHNPEDRDAVLEFLRRAARRIDEASVDMSPIAFEERLEQILKMYSHDGEVSFRLALVKEKMGDIEAALSLLSSDPVAKGYRKGVMFLKRAELHRNTGHADSAITDLKEFLNAEDASIHDFLSAINLMRTFAQDLVKQIPVSSSFRSLSGKDKSFISFELDRNRSEVEAAQAISRELLAAKDDRSFSRDSVEDQFARTAIVLGDFETAVKHFLRGRQIDQVDQIPTAFNAAMALWGQHGEPSREAFNRVAVLDKGTWGRSTEPNYLQCLAITFAVLGRREDATTSLARARQLVMTQPRSTYSAWRYLGVPVKGFLADLDQIDALIAGRDVAPRFMVKGDARVGS